MVPAGVAGEDPVGSTVCTVAVTVRDDPPVTLTGWVSEPKGLTVICVGSGFGV